MRTETASPPSHIAQTKAQSIVGVDYLAEEQFRREFGNISKRTLQRWAHLRMAPPKIRIGKQIYYARADILRWMDARKEFPTDFDE